MTLEQMKKRKKELGYSAEKLAKLAGIPVSTVRKVLGGITSSPRQSTIEALEKVLRKKQGEYTTADLDENPGHMITELYDGYFVGHMGNGKPLPQEIVDQYIVREKPFSYGSLAKKQPPEKKKYTLADYDAMPAGWRGQLINGELVPLGAPSVRHQEIVVEVYVQFKTYIKAKHPQCLVLPSLGLRFNEEEHEGYIPDLVVLCDPQKNKGQLIIGPPDLVVEVLSPSTRSDDMIRKLNVYLQKGVREYWIIDGDAREILRYFFEEDRIMERFSFDEKVPVCISGGELEIDLSSL